MSERESSDRNVTVFRSVSWSVHGRERERKKERQKGEGVNL